ncbi:MAG: dihydroneopterin aldolase [Bacteroidia bacterium]|jgi:dihydroneopterin aldolase
MNYTCSLHDLEFYAYHGLHPEEAKTGTVFKVDVDIETSRHDKESFQKLSAVLNYETIFAIISEQMSQREALIETVAANIMNRFYTTFPDVQKVTVKISKPDPAGLFKSGYAQVVLSR